MKQPLINLVFYTYLESDKISDEIFKCFKMINLFIKNERVRLMTITDFKPAFVEYYFGHFMLALNGFIKIFNKELGAQTLSTKSYIS